MAVSIGSNLASIRALRQLDNATGALSRSFERLASGMRINHASDDAAGLAIADSLRNQSRLYTGAIRNINDGVSALGVMDSTLEHQGKILIRLKELAEQSANGTLSNEQRNALNEEYQALVKEYGRLGEAAEFNGLNLLQALRSSNPSEINLQTGITGETTSVTTVDAADTGSFSGMLDYDDVAGSWLTNSQYLDDIASHVNNSIAYTSVVDDSGQERDLLITFQSGSILLYQRVSDTGGAGSQSGSPFGNTVTNDEHEWVAAQGGSMTVDPTTGEITNIDSGGDPIFDLQFENQTINASIDLTEALEGFRFDMSGDSNTAINFTGVETTDRALSALERTTESMENISQIRGEIGAVQSRLHSTLGVVSASRINVIAAEAQIRDVDLTAETAELVRNQILQNSVAAILAQANSQPQLALTLLTGGE